MCHHYRSAAARKAAWKAEWENEFSVRANLYQLELPLTGFYPLDRVPMIRLDEHGERDLTSAEWGLLPAWWKPSSKAARRQAFQRKTYNARGEEAAEKPTFREAVRRRRCLLPAYEFFDRGYYYHLSGSRPFAFAGVWEQWSGADGDAVTSCTLITTQANALLAANGNPRMPVILTAELEYRRWLELPPNEPIQELMRPLATDVLMSYPAEHSPSRGADGAPVPRKSSHEQLSLFD